MRVSLPGASVFILILRLRDSSDAPLCREGKVSEIRGPPFSRSCLPRLRPSAPVRRRRPADRRRRAHLPHRPQRRRQVQPAEGRSGEQAARRRHDLARARASRRAPRPGSAGSPPIATVFDEVAAGLGELGDLVAPTTTPPFDLAETPARPRPARRRCSTSSRSRTAGASSRRSRSSCRGWRCRRTARCASCRAAGGGGRCSARRWCRSRTCCCSTSRPTTSTSTRSSGWKSHLRDFAGALLFVTHDRAFLSALATRIVELDRGALTSWPGNYASYLEKKAAALEKPRRASSRTARQEAGAGGGVAAPGRQGAAHPERRARQGADGAARRARRAARRSRRRPRWRSTPARRLGQAGVRGRAASARRSAACR